MVFKTMGDFILEKIDPKIQKHMQLIEKLENDDKVLQDFISFRSILNDISYLSSTSFYQSHYVVYESDGDMLGYLGVSPIFQFLSHTTVSMNYALLQTVRGNHFGRNLLTAASNYVLEKDAPQVALYIDSKNKASIKVATYAGFQQSTLKDFYVKKQ